MDKVFQVLFVLIMSIGILGLPAYFYLNARRKRIASEFEQEPDDTNNDPEESKTE